MTDQSGWRAIKVVDDHDVAMRLVPPGAPTSDGESIPLRGLAPIAWLDERRIAYCGVDTHCHVRDVIERRDVASVVVPGDLPTPGLDGKTWYTCELGGQVTRHVIDNFADRPGAP